MEHYLDPLKKALSLNDGSTDIFPITVDPQNHDGTHWHIVFPANFTTKHQYILKLNSNSHLTDQNNVPLQLVSTNKYSIIDTSCNERGQFVAAYGLCSCNAGFGGSTCQSCNIGYEVISQPGQPLQCKRKFGSMCFVDTCGCDPKISGTCVSIGKCNDSVGDTPTCKCNFPYAGKHCERCLDSMDNYALGCVKSRQCPKCIRGSCDSDLKTCRCPARFSGSTCDECATGWSGLDCSIKSDTETPPMTSSNDEEHAKIVNAFRIIGIVLAVIAIVATGSFMLYKRYSHRTAGSQSSVLMLELEQEDNSLVDDEDLSPANKGVDLE